MDRTVVKPADEGTEKEVREQQLGAAVGQAARCRGCLMCTDA